LRNFEPQPKRKTGPASRPLGEDGWWRGTPSTIYGRARNTGLESPGFAPTRMSTLLLPPSQTSDPAANVAQVFLPAGARDFPVPCSGLPRHRFQAIPAIIPLSLFAPGVFHPQSSIPLAATNAALCPFAGGVVGFRPSALGFHPWSAWKVRVSQTKSDLSFILSPSPWQKFGHYSPPSTQFPSDRTHPFVENPT
jgi:hypothetical protein